MPRFAITDIHGCLNTFQALLDKIAFSRKDQLFLLGDFIDRGPDSKGVIDYILHLQQMGYQVQCLRGNHDQMLIDARDHDDSHAFWLINGGKATLKSFAVRHASEIPDLYFDFLMGLDYYLEVENYILVHAGLDFRGEDPLSNYHGMLWARDWYAHVDYNWLGDRIILHGHTPMFRDEVEQLHKRLGDQQFLGIDNGCVYSDETYSRLGLGSLCAFNLDDHSLTFVENTELIAEEPVNGARSRLAAIWSLLSF